ncbi:MAG: hypothetical protein FD123_4049 [Bacteroidetes bacterium]|nr:MAG: hypothetical protein FD123_4049 [Bacteroidota bacterium]
MVKLQFPEFPFRIRNSEGRRQIFDVIRKKWVVLTPEEWVRQHLATYLVETKKYPASLLAIEKTIEVNGLKKRCDILAHDKQGRPLLLAECKAPEVEITQPVFDQAARYNMTTGVEILVLSNGLRHFCCRIDHASSSYLFLPEIPEFGAFDGTNTLS